MSAARIRNRTELLAGLDPIDAGRRALACDLFEAALAAVEPAACTARALAELKADGVQLDGCTVFAIGKAARGMAEAALAAVDVKQGLVLGFESGQLGPLTLLEAAHPVPSPHAAEHGAQVLQMAQALGPNDVALVLISGGGSAMLELPAEGVSLTDIQATTRELLACGADITEVNLLRSALSQLKGGRLARALAPASTFNVVLSDVVGSPLTSIASGPTVAPLLPPSASDAATPLQVAERLALIERLPANVVAALREWRRPAAAESFGHVRSLLAADNDVAQAAMVGAAHARGLNPLVHSEPMAGEATEAAKAFYAAARRAGSAYIGGGETTVTLKRLGHGGRNQEFVLGAAASYAGGLLASLGTDGIDGASEHAGALLDAVTLAHADSRNLEAAEVLGRNDSGDYFRDTQSALLTGRTGTNVTDLCLYLP